MDSQIPPLTLPSGGTVEFVDLDDLTGADVHSLRRVIAREDSDGETGNKLLLEAMRIGIKTWDIPYLAHTDPRTPQANPAAYKRLRARDLSAIEGALEPILALTRPPKAADPSDAAPGSPTQPDSE